MAEDAHTLLLVEDDPGTRTFLADNLSADGYELEVADSARDGLRLLEGRFPDLALIDVVLPDGSGLDLVRRVREADGIASRINPDLPLILVSGRVSELDRLRGLEWGADDYVTKPTASVSAGRLNCSNRRSLGRSFGAPSARSSGSSEYISHAGAR